MDKIDNIKPPLVTTNEKVINCVEEHLVENHTDLSRHDLAEFLYGWYILRTKQHVQYVIQAGSKLKPAFDEFGFGARFDEFLRNLEMHDNDKFENSALYIALNILGSANYDPELKKRFKASQYARVMYDTKVWPDHAHMNAHHPESWAHKPRNMTGRPLLCSDYALFGEDYMNGSDYPDEVRYHGFEKLAETVADWAAMGIELHDTAIDWYHRTKGVKWEFSGLAEQYLTTLLTVSKEVYEYQYNNKLVGLSLPKYIAPESPKIEVQSVETCGCYVTEVSAEALKEARARQAGLDSSMEDMALLNKTADQKKLTALAKPLYNPKGQNSWEHIQQDVGNAIFLVKEGFNRELTNQEYATILFHDCSVKTHPDKVKHSLTSANIAKPILLKCGLFTEQEVDDICQAIIEHDIDMNPEMKFSTFLSDLLASADFNPPNPAWILNKSWSWGIKHGLDYEARLNNTMSKIPGFYGSKGGAVYPKLYKEIHGDEIHEMQQFFDQLTREKCEKIIMEYRKKHHLSDTDITLPDPSMEVLSNNSEI